MRSLSISRQLLAIGKSTFSLPATCPPSPPIALTRSVRPYHRRLALTRRHIPRPSTVGRQSRTARQRLVIVPRRRLRVCQPSDYAARLSHRGDGGAAWLDVRLVRLSTAARSDTGRCDDGCTNSRAARAASTQPTACLARSSLSRPPRVCERSECGRLPRTAGGPPCSLHSSHAPS